MSIRSWVSHLLLACARAGTVTGSRDTKRCPMIRVIGHADAMSKVERPTFRNAYLVESRDGVVGVVRRDRSIWKVFRFGVAWTDQPAEAFATREEAGLQLIHLAAENE